MLVDRFAALDQLLTRYQGFWQCQPFHWRDNCWRESTPTLAAFLDTLVGEELSALEADSAPLRPMLKPWFPELDELASLCELPPNLTPLQPVPDGLGNYIPGRKWQQLRHFAAAMPGVRGPVLEWCAGKGHLGRLLGYQSGRPVVSLEWQAELCDAGQRLATRVKVPMRFVHGDAFSDAAKELVQPEQHAVALHACGELHMRLLQVASQRQSRTVTISPCCYHLIHAPSYQPMSLAAQASELQLTTQDLRMTVQETVTAGGRERRLRTIELTWRLGFDLLQRELRGVDEYLPLPNLQKSWLSGSFVDFAHWAVGVKGLTIPPEMTQLQIANFEQAGAARLPVVARMELVRHLFRRPLELWLVLDRALFLQEQGYRVELSEFCPRHLTPRNILIHAERD
ncbi:MAG: SAM-dependent methyltransferase [Aeromonadaceae bacterium]|nr:SAM-dependent methyltransferase [Aeromonadaceae bacterium]